MTLTSAKTQVERPTHRMIQYSPPTREVHERVEREVQPVFAASVLVENEISERVAEDEL
jgi:hypothetical protein